ncbi:hypothetical protein TNCV_4820301 [Trichonephila clavipes]|nr:hypothetical protein TNCV_4820301 [Trichonephila clavipes]
MSFSAWDDDFSRIFAVRSVKVSNVAFCFPVRMNVQNIISKFNIIKIIGIKEFKYITSLKSPMRREIEGCRKAVCQQDAAALIRLCKSERKNWMVALAPV